MIPTLEEILPKLIGARYFSIVDAKCGYWNVELDKESSYLTTFNSLFGHYRFLRMKFGLKMSQEVFQARSIRPSRVVKVRMGSLMTLLSVANSKRNTTDTCTKC